MRLNLMALELMGVLSMLSLTYSSQNVQVWLMFKENFEKFISKVLTAINFISFQLKSINTLVEPQWDYRDFFHL